MESSVVLSIVYHPKVVRWVFSFAFTLAVEVPIFIALARLFCKKEIPIWRAALAGAVGTCLTHPNLWYTWFYLMRDVWHQPYWVYIFSGELLVSVIESFTFYAIARPIRLSQAIAASFLANAASYGVGNLLRYLDLWPI